MGFLTAISGAIGAIASIAGAVNSFSKKKSEEDKASSASGWSNLASGATGLYNLYNSERSYNQNVANQNLANARADKSLALQEDSYRNGIINSANQYKALGINPASALSGQSTFSGSATGGSNVDGSSVSSPQIDTSVITALAQLKSNEKLRREEIESSEQISEDTNKTNKEIAELQAATSSGNTAATIESNERIASFDRAFKYFQESHNYEKIKSDIDNNKRLTDAQINQISKSLDLTSAQINYINAQSREVEANIEKIGVEKASIELSNVYQSLSNADKKATMEIFKEFGTTKDVYSSILDGSKIAGSSTQLLNASKLFGVGCAYFGVSVSSSSSSSKFTNGGGRSW